MFVVKEICTIYKIYNCKSVVREDLKDSHIEADGGWIKMAAEAQVVKCLPHRIRCISDFSRWQFRVHMKKRGRSNRGCVPPPGAVISIGGRVGEERVGRKTRG